MTATGSRIPYRRVLLKISGESFCRENESGISMQELSSIAGQIRDVVQDGVQLAIVCGGGNILRGRQFAEVSSTIVPSTAHYMGMLATVINGLCCRMLWRVSECRRGCRVQFGWRVWLSRSFVGVVCGIWKRVAW